MPASAKVARLTTLALFSPTPSPSGAKPVKPRARAPPPISVSMDPALVDPAHLQALMLACAHSCAIRLSPSPAQPASPGEPVDIHKLRTALAHSFIVVSVFCSARSLANAGEGHRFLGLGLDLELGRLGERRLVGFGRAVSDVGLTASVHDVVVIFSLVVVKLALGALSSLISDLQVHPSLQRRGIGRKIVEKITRALHSRGIYDISALCTKKERPFFEACGFGDDMMGSTTMLYTRKVHK
ncbi:GCN5-related N-acetyltransferase 3, chloroplastic isoform X1 [Phragmites australis]|uniref:GCN5-related N-acetyltransferase 3, chloroplastic isoform X1 n=1 Tax=Phragmites australis TaxID=29695 RepID=UPI002D77E42C|nr:GCN5-related N-acetyltransferase 3, chloroplastic isoform X1 [Phragmites australis]